MLGPGRPYFNFPGTVIRFPQRLHPLTLPPTVHKGPHFSTSKGTFLRWERPWHVCVEGAIRGKEGKRCSGRQEAGPGAAVRTDQPPWPQRAGRARGSGRGPGRAARTLLGKVGSQEGAGELWGEEREKVTQGPRESQDGGSAGRAPGGERGADPTRQRQRAQHTQPGRGHGARVEGRPTPAASPVRGGSEAEHKPLAGPGSGPRAPGSTGTVCAPSPQPLELRVPEPRLQRDTHPAETAARPLQGPTWHGAQRQTGRAAWAL